MMEQRFPLRRQRSLNEIIEAALNIYGQNFQPLFLIAAIVVPLGVTGAVLQNAIDDDAASLVILLALSVVSGTVSAAANALVLPFGVTAVTLLYMDLKVRREAESASIEEEGANA